jgi:beta-lactamase superfamily II metal-dependent hydrolase
MFFKYAPGEPPEILRPRRVFARIDNIEPGDAATGEPPTVYLDCVDADWLQTNAVPDKPLWQIESDEPDQRISIIEASGKIFKISTGEEAQAEGEWWHLELGEPVNRTVLQYFNLFSDPTARGVISMRKLTRAEKVLVEEVSGCKGIAQSPVEAIRKVLRRLPKPDSLAVYDVGQGSCNALMSHGIPTLYFDFGGSTIGNWRSFPAHLRNFCFTHSPPIVLSHWDWDHWSSALRDHRALRTTWIVPIQSFGNVHGRFVAMLVRNGATLLWCDPKMGVVKLPGGEIRFCKGKKKSRNESGLAMTIGSDPVRVLLPGDASPGNAISIRRKVDHIVVPHHGGRLDKPELPRPTNPESSHLIYSYGVGNIFLHPLTDVRRQARKTWKKNLHTALRDQSGFGHIGVDLTNGGPGKPRLPCRGTRLPCRGRCQLGLVQWIEAPKPSPATRRPSSTPARRPVSTP